MNEQDLEYKRRSADLPKIKTNVTSHCWNPWQMVNIDFKGRVFVCWCDGHLPWPVGHVQDFSSFYDIFNSSQAQTIQQSINDKTYKYCATHTCSMVTKQLPWVSLYLGIDNSCNLSCPSCRTQLIYDKSDEWLAERYRWIDTIVTWAESTDYPVKVVIGSDGDPFASRVYWRALTYLQSCANVRYEFMTNGLLMRNHLQALNLDVLNRIDKITVSIDSPQADTYEQLRRGGKFTQLLTNLEFLRATDIVAHGHMIVQKANLDQVFEFIEFCEQYRLEPEFTVLEDWGTWHDYISQCVHLPQSPDYAKFVATFTDPIISQRDISLARIQQWL